MSRQSSLPASYRPKDHNKDTQQFAQSQRSDWLSPTTPSTPFNFRSPSPGNSRRQSLDVDVAPANASHADLRALTLGLDEDHQNSRLLVPIQEPCVDIEQLGFVLEQENVAIAGYELYVVEPWLTGTECAIKSAVIFTGHTDAHVIVNVYTPALVESRAVANRLWAQGVAAVSTPNSLLKTTLYGYMHVTNVSAVSMLTVVKLPSPASLTGKTLRALLVNINLRRMGLSGRNNNLSLSEPTSHVLEHFIGFYHLASVTNLDNANVPDFNPARQHSLDTSRTPPKSSTFERHASIILGLVSLVQQALAIFGLGPLIDGSDMTPNTTSLHSSLLFAWSTSRSDAATKLREVLGSKAQPMPTGLLDDVTVRGLLAWQRQFGQNPLVNNDHVLPPETLASLLSLVIAIRHKVNALGTNNATTPPLDPFRDRKRFLASIKMYKPTSLPSITTTPYLDILCCQAIKRKYRERFGEESSFSVRRAIKSKIDDVIQQHPPDVLTEEETSDLREFADMVNAGAGYNMDSVQILWHGSVRKTKRNRLIGRNKKQSGGHSTDDTTENELDAMSSSRGLHLIRELGGRASHASQKIRGNMSGFLDQGYARGAFMTPDRERDVERRPAPIGRIESNQTSSTLGLRPSSHEASEVDFSRYRPSGLQLALLESIGDAAPQPNLRPVISMRRNATDMGFTKESLGESLQEYAEDKELMDGSEAANWSSRHRRSGRRHSFATLGTVYTVTRVLTPTMLKVDVDLAMAHLALVSKRRHLQETLVALQTVADAYKNVLDQLDPILLHRAQQTSGLADTVRDLMAQSNLASDNPTGGAMPIKLLTSFKRAQYQQNDLKVDELRLAIASLDQQINGDQRNNAPGWLGYLASVKKTLDQQETGLIDVVNGVKTTFLSFMAKFYSEA